MGQDSYITPETMQGQVVVLVRSVAWITLHYPVHVHVQDNEHILNITNTTNKNKFSKQLWSQHIWLYTQMAIIYWLFQYSET